MGSFWLMRKKNIGSWSLSEKLQSLITLSIPVPQKQKESQNILFQLVKRILFLRETYNVAGRSVDIDKLCHQVMQYCHLSLTGTAYESGSR